MALQKRITMGLQKRITSDFDIAMAQIAKSMNRGWTHAYVYDRRLCPEVIEFLAEHGFDIKIDRSDIHSTITWFLAKEGRKGKIVAPEYSFEYKKALVFPGKVIEAVDARRISGEQQYKDAKEVIEKAKERNCTMAHILEPVYLEVGEKLSQDGIHVQVLLKASLGSSCTRFFWFGDKGSYSIFELR